MHASPEDAVGLGDGAIVQQLRGRGGVLPVVVRWRLDGGDDGGHLVADTNPLPLVVAVRGRIDRVGHSIDLS